MGMELKIIRPKEDGFVKVIEFNNEELKAGLVEGLKTYDNRVYAKETIQDGKSDRATLNKFRAALEAKRIEIKKLCMAPYLEFEKRVKELVGMVDKSILAIDTQVKNFEEQKRDEKRGEIEKFWAELETNVKTLVSLERIFDKKWLNVTVSMKAIKEEITEFVEKVESELALIEELETEFEAQVIRVYLDKFNVVEAMAENKALLEQKKKREEYAEAQRKKAEEEARAKEAAALEQQAKKPQPVPEQAQEQPPVEQPRPAQVPVEEPVEHVDFRVYATREQLNNLKIFLNDNGIKFGPVPQVRKAA